MNFTGKGVVLLELKIIGRQIDDQAHLPPA
jgi:hypothetical protein